MPWPASSRSAMSRRCCSLAARWGLSLVLLLLLGSRRLAADWPQVRAHLLAVDAAWRAGLLVLQHRALFGAALHHRDQCQHRAGRHAAADLPRQFPVLRRPRDSALQIVGFLLSIAGIALTASHGDPARLLTLDVNFGDALMLVAVVVYSGYSVALRFQSGHPLAKPDDRALRRGADHLAAVRGRRVRWRQAGIVPDAAWLGRHRLYRALSLAARRRSSTSPASSLIGANRAGLFINLVPIFGTLLSILIARREFPLYHALAMALVLGGIWLAETSGRKMGAEGSKRPSSDAARRRNAAAWPNRSTCAPAPAPARPPGTAHRDRAARWHRRPAGCGRAGSWRC